MVRMSSSPTRAERSAKAAGITPAPSSRPAGLSTIGIEPAGVRATHNGVVAVAGDNIDVGAGTDLVLADLDGMPLFLDKPHDRQLGAPVATSVPTAASMRTADSTVGSE